MKRLVKPAFSGNLKEQICDLKIGVPEWAVLI
jgi:hypothetical protein